MVDNNEQQAVSKNYDTSSYDQSYDTIKSQFDAFQPAPINVAVTDWANLASRIGYVADNLMTQIGHPLNDAWESKTSPDAQRQLQMAQATARALADQCLHMARANDWAYQYAQWYKDHMPGTGMYHSIGGMLSDPADDNAAREHLAKFMTRYNEVIASSVPPSVQAQYMESRNKTADQFTQTPGPRAGRVVDPEHSAHSWARS